MDAPTAPQLEARRFKTLRTISALMLREMSTTYGRSPGGYLWALLEPAGGIAVLTLVLSVGLRIRTPSLGDNFPIFFASGLLIFLAYVRTSGNVATAITFSRPLLHYPGVTFVDAMLARLILQTLTQMVILIIISGGIMLIFEPRAVQIDPVPILFAFLMAVFLAFGIGSLHSVLFPMFPVWQSIWGMLTFPLLFLSGILYIYEELPRIGQQVLWYNPLMHLTALSRSGFYPTYDPSWISLTYVLLCAFIPAVLGMILAGRYYRAIISNDFL